MTGNETKFWVYDDFLGEYEQSLLQKFENFLRANKLKERD